LQRIQIGAGFVRCLFLRGAGKDVEDSDDTYSCLKDALRAFGLKDALRAFGLKS
jgi:hypothetical protein